MLFITLADIERKLCMPFDAIERYEKLLKLSPQNELVLKGAASSYLVLAYHNYSIGWTLGSAMSVVNGIKHAENLIKLVESKNGGSKFESVWKLLGDLTTFTRNVLTDMAFIKINNINSMSSFISHHHHHHHISGLGYGDKDLFIDNLDILLTVLKRGEAAYRKVIDIQQKSGSICSESWYDLGMNIYEQANTMLTVKGQGSSLLYYDNIDCKIINSLIDEARGCFSKGI